MLRYKTLPSAHLEGIDRPEQKFNMDDYFEGKWAFFQRSKDSGGGYWFGRTYSDCFWLEFDQPTALSIGIKYLLTYEDVSARQRDFDDEFRLT